MYEHDPDKILDENDIVDEQEDISPVVDDETTPVPTFLSNRTYDLLKWFALIILPAAGTLYLALSGIWGLPFGDQIVGTIVAVEAFLGVALGVSSKVYKGSQ